METVLSTPLKEQENFKELFRLLDEKGMKAEKGQVMELVDYIDNMDQQFGKVLTELRSVKRQVKKLEERGIRQTVLRAIGKFEAKVYAARAELIDLKDQLIDGVNRTIHGFKSRGILVIYKTIDFIGIKRGLMGVKRQLHQSLETADRGIASLGNIGDEMYGVRTHLGNIKRELAGKERITAGSREMEKGAVFQIQKMLYGTMGVLDSMEKRTDQTIQKLDSFGERAQEIRRTSLDGTAYEICRMTRKGRIQESQGLSLSRRKQEMRKPSVRGTLESIQAEKNRGAGQQIQRRAKLAAR